MCILCHIKTLLYHYYTYYFSYYFSYYITADYYIIVLYHYYITIILIILLLILIISGFVIPIFRSWQTPILVLCAERWLISVQERQQSFGMTRQALFAKPSPPIQVNKDYYTHYFLYYTYYFECLSRIQQPVTSTYALQADIHRSYEMYVAITSTRKLSFLSHGPNSCPFLLYYTHYITIISYYTYYFINPKQHLGAYSLPETFQLAHPPQWISQHTNTEPPGLIHRSPTCRLQW